MNPVRSTSIHHLDQRALHVQAFTLAALFLIGMGTVESRNKNPKSIDIDLGTEVKDQNDDPVKGTTTSEQTEAQLLPVVSRGVQRTD